MEQELKIPETIGASKIAAILGYSPYETPLSAWRSLMGIESSNPESELSKYRKRMGQLMEDAVIAYFEEQTGKTVAIRQPDTQKRVGIFHATPDGITSSGELVEAKTSSDAPWREVPYHYYVQVQVQMYVHGAEVTYLPAVCSMYYQCFTVPFNKDDAEMFIERAQWFYDTYIKTGIEPPPSYERMLRKRTELDTLPADDTIRNLVARYNEVRQTISLLEKKLTEIRDEIRAHIKPMTRAVDTDGRLLVTRSSYLVSGKVDVNALQLYYPDVYREVVQAPREVERLIVH